jgi:ribosomal protein S18 acetylase RimI-like enzyme
MARPWTAVPTGSGQPNWQAFLPPDLRLRPAKLIDRAVRSVFYAEMRAVERTATAWSESMWEAFVADQFRLRELHYQQRFPRADVMMIEARGGAGGRFATVGTVTIDMKMSANGPRVARIVTIEVGIAARGHGIGTRIVEALAAGARAAGAGRLDLCVAVNNAAAIRFYERIGFTANATADPAALYREMRLDLAAH